MFITFFAWSTQLFVLLQSRKGYPTAFYLRKVKPRHINAGAVFSKHRVTIKKKKKKKISNFSDTSCYFNGFTKALRMFLLIAYYHPSPEPLGPASGPPTVPVEVMVSRPPAWLDARCCQGRVAPCSLPYQPARSHCCFPAGVFAYLWASWSTDLIQVETNSTKTASDAQSQHKGNRQPKQGEAISPFCSSSTSLCQMKVMTTSDWLASLRTLSKYSSHQFLAWQTFPLPVPIH